MNAKNESANHPKVKKSARQMRASNAADAASGDERYPHEKMIAEAAYYHAKQRGFAPGNEISDWLRAEDELKNLLRSA